jgi:type IV secretion system protein VirB4
VARLDLADMGDFIKVLAGNERSVRRLDALRARLGDAPAAWLGPFMTERSAA